MMSDNETETTESLHSVFDCATGEVEVVPLTAAERAELAILRAQAAQPSRRQTLAQTVRDASGLDDTVRSALVELLGEG